MFQYAFVTHDMIELGSDPVAAVVRAERTAVSSRLVITIAPLLYPPPSLSELIITIDSEDLIEVKKLLGEEGGRWVPADDEGAVPDEDIAWAALRKIAELDQIRNEDETWKTIAMRAIDYAQDALGRMDDNGTPTNA